MIFKPKTSASIFNRGINGIVSGSLVLALSSLIGCSSLTSTSSSSQDFPKITPFSRVAKLPVVKVKGKIDYKATYAKSRAASLAIATYVARFKEADKLGASVIKGIDWKLGGTSKKCLEKRKCSKAEINHSVIQIPSPNPIDPTDKTYLKTGKVTKSNTKKANVVEFCNKKYAGMAMGVKPIIGKKKVVNGYAHAASLPCEVSVWNDDKFIYVDMLDPSAIFTLFFSDVLFSADMQDPAFAKALNKMPPQVKSEIVAIIYAALKEFDPNMVKMDMPMGPEYSSIDEVINLVKNSPLKSPYKHMTYTKASGAVFTEKESKQIAQTIINTMSVHGKKDAGKHPTKINAKGDTLDSILSPKSGWRSARVEPITIPGKNHIIEACSPKYAKMAMGTGLHHVNALPCEITVKIIKGGKQLVISYLDPAFMLNALFADIPAADKAKFGKIPQLINDDLQKIVKVALDVNLGIKLNKPKQLVINMLP